MKTPYPGTFGGSTLGAAAARERALRPAVLHESGARGPNGRGRLARRALTIALCLLVLSTLACERRKRLQSKLITASATGSGQVLDGMQLESARRVAREQAKEAMEQRNPARLHMLRKWVEGRASVPVFPAEDLAALDMAVACLEHEAPTDEQRDLAEKSRLADAARRACEPSATE